MNYPSPTLHLLPVRERPAYRVSANADECNISELLAAVIGGPHQIDIAFALLGRFDLEAFYHASVDELAQVKGVGEATAVRIKAALRLSQRCQDLLHSERRQVRSPADVAGFLLSDMGRLEQEEMRVVVLNARMRVLGIHTVYRGSLSSISVRPVEVFRPALKHGAAAGIVATHNHPSGDPTPSPEDVAVTRELVAAGNTLGLELFDHLIVSLDRYVSLKERGLGFDERQEPARQHWQLHQSRLRQNPRRRG